MNFIQIKQVQDLDASFGGLSGALNNTGQILIDFLSGNSVFSGEKTFTGAVVFQDTVTTRSTLSGRKGVFSSLATSPYLFPALFEPYTGLHISGQDLLLEPSLFPIQGGNLYVRGLADIGGGLTITGQDGEPTALIPEFIRNSGILYQTGLDQLNVGFQEAIPVGFQNTNFNVSGSAQVLGDAYIEGDLIVSGKTTITDTTSGKADGYFERLYVTGEGGAWTQLSGIEQKEFSQAKGPTGAVQFQSGEGEFSGNAAFIFNTGTSGLQVSGGILSSGLISGATDLIVDGNISGDHFYSMGAGTKYFSGNSNVTIISDAVLSLSGDSRTELHNAVPYYKAEGVSTTPHTYDTTIAIEGYRTDITNFSITIPTPGQTESGQQIILKDIGGNAAINNIEVSGAGTTTIDGTTGTFLTRDYASLALFSDGANWFSLYSGNGI